MRFHWIPWKFIIRRLAKTHGFLDPVDLMARFNKFAQPSEVAVPGELMRAGMILHARGLINARTIQGNLDWVWPYWVRRQFDPKDRAFVPRSFSLTHVNITNRNWTALGIPDGAAYPIVDPRGMVTPFFDGWSIEGWGLPREGEGLVPATAPHVDQRLVFDRDSFCVETELHRDGFRIRSAAQVVMVANEPVCRIHYTAEADGSGFFAVALRPYNPEGISFIHQIAVNRGGTRWMVNNHPCITIDPALPGHYASGYHDGDVYYKIQNSEAQKSVACDVGMASAAALFPVDSDTPRHVRLDIPLRADPETPAVFPMANPDPRWSSALSGTCRLVIPDKVMQFLFDAAVRTLILHTPLDVYPGPFYYKRFWFRDTVFISHALLAIGLHDRTERLINHFIPRQTVTGYFKSQNGEWDSNGQVLWLFKRFKELTGRSCSGEWISAAVKGARWILRKRLPADSGDLQAGLFPAGFSAEHLGNNDFYYWDDLWGIAGLKAAAELLSEAGDARSADRCKQGAEHFALCVERSLLRSRHIRSMDAVPASPHRRMDAGAVGSIIASYPLQLWPANAPRLLNTLEYLLDRCFIDHAFFQDMIHSGFNMYITLHCAQCLLRAGDPRFLPMVRRVADLATATGQWPEAIHPQTLGGCMGDGHHVWAAAEWIMMMRNMFVSEEKDRLILFAGVPEAWCREGGGVEMGPVHTRFGAVHVKLRSGADGGFQASWTAEWREPPSRIVVKLMGRELVEGRDAGAEAGELRIPG